MKHFLLSLLILFVVTSCSSGSKEKDSNEDSTNPLLVSEEPKGIDSVWNFYSGSIDDNSQFVMELSFNGENVDGNYWYVKHRKRIRLKGKIDTILQEVILTEKVNGEPTGHFKFRVDEDMLQGSWSLPMKKQAHGYKPANLYCDLIYSVSKSHMNPEFHDYEFNHNIEVFDPEIDDFKIEEGTDICSVVTMNKDKFVFDYFVIGHNYHMGFISGTGTLLTPKLGQFIGDEGCEMMFKFYDDSLTIDTGEMTCRHYAGLRAYFGGTLFRTN